MVCDADTAVVSTLLHGMLAAVTHGSLSNAAVLPMSACIAGAVIFAMLTHQERYSAAWYVGSCDTPQPPHAAMSFDARV